MVGFAIVILVLTAGMGLALRRIEEVTARQLARARAEASEITLTERLRWSGELLISAGRGYLLSGDLAQLEKLRLARQDFDAAVRELETTELDPRGIAVVEDVRRAAMRLRATQDRLLRQRDAAEPAVLVEQFEIEAAPARLGLRDALHRLVVHKEAVIERVYEHAKRERERLKGRTYALLAALAAGSLGVAWLSARRLARIYRREAEALETARRALRARDEIIEIVAHDLRSPLGAITMRAELLHKRTGDPLDRRQAAAIVNIAMRMGHLIKSMLDANVIEASMLEIHRVPCDLGGLVQEAIEVISTIAESKQIRLEQRVPEPGLVLQADRERMFQVLSNLLGNAIKFTPAGGRVTLSAERSGGAVEFAISDTGPGIASEHHAHVFERYWRDEARGTKGTGLGLFIARTIIAAHGGEIWLESSPGHGATFRFTLPLAAPATAPEAPAPAA